MTLVTSSIATMLGEEVALILQMQQGPVVVVDYADFILKTG